MSEQDAHNATGQSSAEYSTIVSAYLWCVTHDSWLILNACDTSCVTEWRDWVDIRELDLG